LRTQIALALCTSASVHNAIAQQPAEEERIEEIVVTGTYMRRLSQFDVPSPVTSVTREDLGALGVGKVSDFIDDLTINTGSQNNPDAFTQNFSTGTSNINLRGLGVSSTLVLVNGRRQTQSAAATDRGENFVDTSSLPPMIAFDRIEILKDGATALYGSEAVAGVANFLTRSNFNGFEMELELRGTEQYPQDDKSVSALYGVGNQRTHFLVAASLLDRDQLTTNDRRLSTTADDLSQAGNPGSYLVPSLPANPVYAPIWTAAFDSNLNGVADAVEPQLGLPPVPGASLPVFADPSCAAIAAQDPKVIPSFAANVPSPIGNIPIGLCQFDFGSFFSIVPEEQRLSAYFELTHAVSDTTGIRIEYHQANNEATRLNSPSFPFAAFPTVPATHPDNVFGTDVNFIGRIIGAGGVASPSTHDSDTRRLAVSLSGQINSAWSWDFGLTSSENDFVVDAEDTLVDRFGYAMRGLGGSDCDPVAGTPGVGPCVYFNPFGTSLTGTGTANSPALFDYLLGQFNYTSKSSLDTMEFFAAGELGRFGAGSAGLAVGGQIRQEDISYDYDANANAGNFLFFTSVPDFAGTRDVNAVFVELALPLTASLDMQIAARYEDYGGRVSSTDPKVSVLWRPTDTVSVRGSVGTSFRAPSLFQAFGVQTTLSQLIDPGVGIPQFFPVRAQPNPNGPGLLPEEADVLNLGVSWAATDRLELGVDYWSFDYDQVIIQQNAQALLNAAAIGDPQALSQVIRDPASGLLLRVESYYANASKLATDGLDLALTFSDSLGDGSTYRVGAEATVILTYDLDDPQAGRIDGLGRRNFSNFATSTPEWRANVFFNWARARHGLNVYARYIDSYLDDQVQLGQGAQFFRPVDHQLTFDAQYSYRFGRDAGPTVSVGGINLFDEDPPHLSTNGGYDSKVHDPRGRVLYVRAGFQF
jgi:outer membrane receptor protein involved in Fe transport